DVRCAPLSWVERTSRASGAGRLNLCARGPPGPPCRGSTTGRGAAPNASASPDAAQRPIGHKNSWTARVSDAPGLILAAPYASTRHAAAMETRTTPISVAETFFIIDLRCCACVGHFIGVLGASVGSLLPVTFARYRESRRTKAVRPSTASKVTRQAMSAVSQRLA